LFRCCISTSSAPIQSLSKDVDEAISVMVETRFNVGMTWYVDFISTWGYCRICSRLHQKYIIAHIASKRIDRARDSEGCASAVKRILGKIEGTSAFCHSQLVSDLTWAQSSNLSSRLDRGNGHSNQCRRENRHCTSRRIGVAASHAGEVTGGR
jgi:hypothetical protein